MKFFRNIVIVFLIFAIPASSMGMEIYEHYCSFSKETDIVLKLKKCCGDDESSKEDNCCHTTKEYKKADPASVYGTFSIKAVKAYYLLVSFFHSELNVFKFRMKDYISPNSFFSPPPLSGKEIKITQKVLLI